MAQGHRITINPSDVHVEITVGGEKVAESDRPVLLDETGLPTRYYLPKDDVRAEILRPSPRTSHCPFKGEASYWSVEVDGKMYEDVAWSYEEPIPGARQIAGLLCFYPERVEMTITPTEGDMGVQLNHTIVWCRDQQVSAPFLAEVLGLPAPTRFGPFLVVEADNGVSLDYHDTDGTIAPQHYAFLIGEDEFDEIFGRIQERGLEYWADPGRSQPGRINRNDGGRGVYFQDPDGHLLEIITRPYGSGG